MGAALDAYEELVCKANGHTHGAKGLLDCMLKEHAQRKQSADNS